jgi:uncharacterized iron-regulated membrane protein
LGYEKHVTQPTLLDVLAIWLLVSGLVLWWKKRKLPYAERMASRFGKPVQDNL